MTILAGFVSPTRAEQISAVTPAQINSVTPSKDLKVVESNLVEQLAKLKLQHKDQPELMKPQVEKTQSEQTSRDQRATPVAPVVAMKAPVVLAEPDVPNVQPQPQPRANANANAILARAQSIHSAAVADSQRIQQDSRASADQRAKALALAQRAESVVRRAQLAHSSESDRDRLDEVRMLADRRAAEKRRATEHQEMEISDLIARAKHLEAVIEQDSREALNMTVAIEEELQRQKAEQKAAEEKEKALQAREQELKAKHEEEAAEQEKEKSIAVQMAVKQAVAEERASADAEIKNVLIHNASATAALDAVSDILLRQSTRPPAETLGGEIYELSLLMRRVLDDQRHIGEQLVTYAGLSRHLDRGMMRSAFLGNVTQKRRLFTYLNEVDRLLAEAVVLHDELRAGLSKLLVDDTQDARDMLHKLHRMTEFTVRKLYVINKKVQPIKEALEAAGDGGREITTGLLFDELIKINKDAHEYAVAEGLAKAVDEPKIIEVAGAEIEVVARNYDARIAKLRENFIGEKVDLINDMDRPLQPKMAAAMLLSLNKEFESLWDRNARTVDAIARVVGALETKVPHDVSGLGMLAELVEERIAKGESIVDGEAKRVREVVTQIRNAKSGFVSAH